MNKFFCDRNVYRLAKYLRFAGFDTMTRQDLSLSKIDTICKKERRTFITRNKSVRNFRSKVVILDSDCVYEQIKAILTLYKFDMESVSTRCLKCNVKLRISNNDTSMKYCPRCGKYFWKGTHYTDMLKIIS